MSSNRESILVRNDLLQALIDHAEHGITIAEREGEETVLLYVNEAFERLTGYSEEECLFRDCRFLQGDDRDQEARRQIRDAIEQEKPIEVTLRNYRKDGTLFWNDLTISPYFDEQEGVMYYIGVQKDITAQIELQQELEACKQALTEQQ